VIGLYAVAAVVAQGAEVLGEAADVGRRHALAAHVVGADAGRVAAGDDRRPARGANAGHGKRPGEADALLRPPVEVGRARVGVAVAAQVGADVLAGDPEDVRSARLACLLAEGLARPQQGPGDQGQRHGAKILSVRHRSYPRGAEREAWARRAAFRG